MSEMFLTIEGLIREIENNPPQIGQEAESREQYVGVLGSLGFLPLLTVKGNSSLEHYFGICIGDGEEVENFITRISMAYQDEFPRFGYNQNELKFVLMTELEFAEIKQNGFALLLDKKARQSYLHTVDSDSTALEGFKAIINYAFLRNASDIHVEPEEEYGRIRFRIDGVLRIAEYSLTPEITRKVIAIIKNASRMKMDEHMRPQDGRISFSNEEIAKNQKLSGFSLRVSIIPTVHGEKAVLRVMKIKEVQYRLDSIGMDTDLIERFSRRLHQPYGLILVTGPTGSGKTTTLYGGLNELNDGSRNIMTIEDPVEIPITGLTQSQVNPLVDFTFVSALRASLRQDPDVILVGEIRDIETAQTAVYAANTGHLVLATLHTNDSISALERIMGFGLHKIAIASSLLAVMSQRLVRRICANCSEEYLGNNDLTYLLGNDYLQSKSENPISIKLRKAKKGNKSCPLCQGMGYSGRFPLIEYWGIGDDERKMIMAGESNPDAYLKAAVEKGFKPLSFLAMEALLLQKTDISEVLRVAVKEDDFLRMGPHISQMLKRRSK